MKNFKNLSKAMETETISKNGASLKSLMSRENLSENILAKALVLLLFVPITACSQNPSSANAFNKDLIGIWQEEDKPDGECYVFFDNGTGLYMRYVKTGSFSPYRYSVQGNALMTFLDGSTSSGSSSLYTFSVSGDKLTLKRFANRSEVVTFKKTKQLPEL